MKKENQVKESFLDLDLHVILTFFDKKIGPIPYFVYPNTQMGFNLEKISKLMFQEEEGFFIYSNPSFGTANYYFEINSPLARGEKEMMIISFIFNPTVHDPERFQVLLKQFIRDLKQNRDIYLAFHRGEVSFEKFLLNYDKLRKKFHSLYHEGLEVVSEEVFPL
ncbi:MAG TPA: hypothetical protein VMV95_00460 [Bacillota bacterium]|nr:hypothetical protein [Bacillota bacterium]